MMQMIDVLVRYNTWEEENLVSHSCKRQTGRIDTLSELISPLSMHIYKKKK